MHYRNTILQLLTPTPILFPQTPTLKILFILSCFVDHVTIFMLLRNSFGSVTGRESIFIEVAVGVRSAISQQQLGLLILLLLLLLLLC